MSKSRRPKRYVRRSERTGDKVCNHYLGSLTDPVTRILVQVDDLAQAQNDSTNDSAERELWLQEELETCQEFLAFRSTRLVWRRRRQIKDRKVYAAESVIGKGKMAPRENQRSNGVSVSQDDWQEIVEGATQGDEAALEQLKHILRYNAEICERLGDVSGHVQMMLIDIIGAESISTRESVKIEIEKLRGRLVGRHTAEPLEQLLIEQVVTTMLDLSIQQIGAMQPHIKETLRRRWERRMERSRKRHLAAIHAVLEVQKTLYGNNQHFAE